MGNCMNTTSISVMPQQESRNHCKICSGMIQCELANQHVDALTILSRFNITNFKLLVKSFRKRRIELTDFVEQMREIAHKTDYFYLCHVSKDQLGEQLHSFFTNYLPFKIVGESPHVISEALLISSFNTCWHVAATEQM